MQVKGDPPSNDLGTPLTALSCILKEHGVKSHLIGMLITQFSLITNPVSFHFAIAELENKLFQNSLSLLHRPGKVQLPSP